MAGGPARIARHQDIHGRGAREALSTAVPTALLRLSGQVDRAVAQAAQGGEGAMPSFRVDEGIPIGDLAYELPDDDGIWMVGAQLGFAVTLTATERTLMVVTFSGSWGGPVVGADAIAQRSFWTPPPGSVGADVIMPPFPAHNETLTCNWGIDVGPESVSGGAVDYAVVTLYGYRIGNA